MQIAIYCNVPDKTIKRLKKDQAKLTDGRADMTVEELFRDIMNISESDINSRIRSFEFTESLISVEDYFKGE